MLRCVAWWYVYTRTNEPGDADTTWQKDEAGAANRPVTGFMLTKVNACLGDCLRTAVALTDFFFYVWLNVYPTEYRRSQHQLHYTVQELDGLELSQDYRRDE